ncbi:MAG: anti-sigma factor antagonist [Lachnospiraceae bacterium]|nr:anti-sigma factor antagonist [Lachnospiraceae bacterium]MCI5587263.1 anti-sigma factor antagonist [Lachnospiraceae bacterium]
MRQEDSEAWLHYELKNNCLVIYITDDLDHHAVGYLREKSDRLIDAGNIRNVIFDFKGVDFMDSSGIGLIMGRYKKVMFIGGRAAVTNIGQSVDRIFKISGLYKIIEKYNTPDEAIKAFNKSGRME